MATPALLTTLFVCRSDRVRRHHLIDRLNEGPYRDLTLISAPAGFRLGHPGYRLRFGVLTGKMVAAAGFEPATKGL